MVQILLLLHLHHCIVNLISYPFLHLASQYINLQYLLSPIINLTS